MSRPLTIHIIGAGISGLTLALALRQAGLQPVLYEQASQLGEVGAGITVGPNAARVLTHLGVEPYLREYLWEPRHTGILNYKTGERIQYSIRGKAYTELFGAPLWHIHRADLINGLAAALEQGDSTPIQFNHRLDSLLQDENGVQSTFDNGQTARCDILIACDGIKSQVRDDLFESSVPEFTGYVAWRGLIDRASLPDLSIDPDFALYAGQGKMLARYAVRKRQLINVVAISQQAGWREEGWAIPADPLELAQEFAGWHSSVTDLLDAMPTERCLKWALHSRQPIQSWVNGRVALLGDAAHPMTPFFGVGAAIGIEDAIVMARSLSDHATWEDALASYERTRVPRGNRILQESSRQGLYLLNIKPGDTRDRSMLGEDALDMFGYDAVNVELD